MEPTTPSHHHAGEASSVTSPTEPRAPSRLDDTLTPVDTLRRRPEPAGYGSITSPSALSTPQFHESRERTQSRGSQSHSHAAATARSPMLGPDRGRPKPRKPPMTRRTSSSAQAPHRGEFFSVDDALDEVEADQAESQQPQPTYASSTVRRRPALSGAPPLSRVHSRQERFEEDDRDDQAQPQPGDIVLDVPPSESDMEQRGDGAEDDADMLEQEEIHDEMGDDDDDDGDVSDAESFTLKDRQQAINETHPFGIRLWKPALYKKDRSVQKNAEGDIHSSPGGHVSRWLLFFNIIWTICFGWWMSLIAFVGAIVCFLFAAAPSGRDYGRVLWGLSGYLFYPFGKFVRLEQQEPYIDEDQGEGRSISEYEQWQSGDLEYGRLFFGPERGRSIIGRSRRSIDSGPSETDSLLGRTMRGERSDSDAPARMKRRLFGRGQWNIGRVIFFLFFYLLLTPSLFIVSGICWFLVFWIPMGKVTMLLVNHLRRHPLALSFESDISTARIPTAPHSSILVCTYRAVGLKYWKYTIDGTNIFLINLMAVVLFVIFDWLVLDSVLHIDNIITSSAFLFVAGLFSIIPLAYFIGQAVASISAQSSMGLGAAINAFFSTIVEVFLYCVALNQGKGALVEGSIVGSIFAGILFLPGLSMCFGAIKRKTQRFNARSAGVTSTMLLFAVIGAFGPTLFYQIYGTHELNCLDCVNYGNRDAPGMARDCKRCYFSQTPALDDRFYLEAVRPYCYMAAAMLFMSYIIGLWFTLRTHAAVIWNTEIEEKKHEEHLFQQVPQRHIQPSVGETTGADIRDSHLYKRILGQSLRQVGLHPGQEDSSLGRQAVNAAAGGNGAATTPHVVPPKTDSIRSTVHIPGFTDDEDAQLVHHVTEIAATAATVAARDARAGVVRRQSGPLGGGGTVTSTNAGSLNHRPTPIRTATFPDAEDAAESVPAHATTGTAAHGGHDAPNWSRLKSAVILMGATVLYAIIAEILVDTVDVVLEGFAIDEKFLGITLFALVPNTTEFLNAISFAMNGNIALSMEIGSAYALQVCLLQIPALVLFSAAFPRTPPGGGGVGGGGPEDLARYTFSLLFPQWDMVTVILCVFLLSYMYGEGKSNYFKGSILLLSYLVVVVGYYFSGFGAGVDGLARFDTWSAEGGGGWVRYEEGGRSFKTVGRGTSGVVF
ncbi:Low affinity vacuolar monovalent cation/H(+) antiporter [Pleurostoma richardsiae]|uniref:Low affinity vacuolar monovalent cation/H(+) antiporter n=1 Tax=Pleurostoma richardsiae TaxID=41990 RepID=A0AA38S5W6_9PEZI|nr:Low affinity vacuolar monovalent cation/H(+) antiporter [Pleurostoma richardsiae]